MTTDSSAATDSRAPGLKDLIMLDTPADIRLSPDGRRATISVRRTNWQENRYENICHVQDLDGETMRPLHRAGSTSQMEWLDNDTLAILKSEPDDDEAQIWLHEGLVGDAWRVTAHEGGVEWFKPFSGGILYRAQDPKRKRNEERSDRFGTFRHFEQESSASSLYFVDLAALRLYEASQRSVTETEAKKLVRPVIDLGRLLPEPLHIFSAVPCPTGEAIYLNCRRRDDLIYFRDTSAFRLVVDAPEAVQEHLRRENARQATGERETTGESGAEKDEDVSFLGRCEPLHVPRFAFVIDVSPDGERLLISHQGRDERMYTRRDLWLIDREAALAASDAAEFLSAMRNMTGAADIDVLNQQLTAAGIVATWVDGTVIRATLFSETGEATLLSFSEALSILTCHVSEAGAIGFLGASASSFPEAYVAAPVPGVEGWHVRQLTDLGMAVAGWPLGTVEVIRWQSRDGTEIEGVLRKPPGFDPTKRYPLVFVVHGGPSWFSSAHLLTSEELRYYPGVQFADKDVLVLKPNYRGSIGRGQAFGELNVDNLGIGDLWDLESAIDHLATLGWVDEERVGCMGWSQGGYISAYAGLHSHRFRAVSVGAGISDWYTYHISNDIPDFTVDYLSASPFEDRAPYARTAPITNLGQASTPMLIQHGTEDRRVPLSNAMELYRGLKQKGIPVELFLYPGMAHPITRPRENHAVMHQNLAWFSHYLLGEDLALD